ncbi:hypothetical protein [Fusobacterium polymorphum]|uniref:hypothetical protein n=1 Tax=Fusobacterium nucleatum subsp. polymorphum TaxID=76857 RepID=UPI00300AE209
MSKKDFNKGAKLGIKLSEDIVKSNTESIKKINETIKKINSNTDNIQNIINTVIRTQEENDVEKLFGIVKTLDSKDLEKEEKIILLQFLNEIGKFYEPNENQKIFKLKLLKYLNVAVNETLVENNINNFVFILENIEKKEEKIIYKLISEYLYLDEFSSLDDYEDILSTFHYAHHFKKNIEAEIELKIQLFGLEILYNQFIEDKNDEKDYDLDNKTYYEKEERKNIELSEDCAGIFFKDTQNENNYYIETSNFIIYPISNQIIALNKISLKKTQILEALNIKDVKIIFKNKTITSYNDILYIVIENNLYYFNLNEFKEIFILKINEKLYSDNSKYEITNLSVEKENMVFINKDFTHLNLETLKMLTYSMNVTTNYDNYILKNNFVYFICEDIMHETSFWKEKNYSNYFLIKLNLFSGIVTKVTNSFTKQKFSMLSWVNILSFYYYNNYITIVYEKEESLSLTSNSIKNYEKWVINLNNNNTYSYIFLNRILQVEQYKDYIIYNNLSKNFILQKHNFLSDKKTVLTIGYGKKSDFDLYDNSIINSLDRVFDPESYEEPEEYKRIGKWIFDEINSRIIDIEK